MAQQQHVDNLKQKLNEVSMLQNQINVALAQQGVSQQDIDPLLATLKEELNKERDALERDIKRGKVLMEAQETEIGYRDDHIQTREDILRDRLGSINEHKDLLRTRDRMLQLSQEKNIYKQKVIYTLITMIIAVFLVMIVGYVYFA